jgi:electron transport complex protein RnfG
MMDKLKTALVLLIIGAVSGLLIYGTNELTKDGIIAIRQEREQSYYMDIFSLDAASEITFDKITLSNGLDEEVILYDTTGNLIGYIYKGTDNNNYGQVTTLVGIKTNGEIASVVISSTTNTATFVKNIETNYLSPFAGQDTESITFDAKTGATYTYGSVSKIVTLASEYFIQNRGVSGE